MRINGDCVLEEQNAWNVQNGTKKMIAGIVTVSLLAAIADSVCAIPPARQMSECSSVSGEARRWGIPVQMGEAVRREQIWILNVADTMEHPAETMESPQVPVQEIAAETGYMEEEEVLMNQEVQFAIPEIMPGESTEVLPEENVTEEPSNNYLSYRGFLIDQEGMICGFDPAQSDMTDGYLELPAEQCMGIRSTAFEGVGNGIFEVYLPSNIQNIEAGALAPLGELTWIEAEGTEDYTARDGILFAGTELMVFPAGRTGIFEMPQDVTAIRACAFANTSLSKIDMRKCQSISYDAGIFGGSAGCEIMEGENGS